MKQPSVVLGILIILNACIGGFTMIMVSRALSGTGAYQEIQHILGSSAGMSVVIIGGGMASLVSLLEEEGARTGREVTSGSRSMGRWRAGAPARHLFFANLSPLALRVPVLPHRLHLSRR